MTSYTPYVSGDFVAKEDSKAPLLSRPPELKPQWMITPFDNRALGEGSVPEGDMDAKLRTILGRSRVELYPRAMYAIAALFRRLARGGQIGRDDEVYITTTTDSFYVSSCVTSAIEQTCGWNRSLGSRTRAILAIHEFGFPHPRLAELRSTADKRGIPLVEDCAYAWGTEGVGRAGDLAIYSLTKFFPLQFGGLLAGPAHPGEVADDDLADRDPVKEAHIRRLLASHLPSERAYAELRRQNYLWYQGLFGTERTYFPFADGVVPGAFVLKAGGEDRMKELSERIRSFGIECGNYWRNSAIFFPVHHLLGPEGRAYIAGAVLGALNRRHS